MLVGFDPDAANSITQLAQAAYARNPIPQVPVSAFRAAGAAVYAPTADARTWQGQSMWEPRLGTTYKLGEKTVVKAGYGLYYDTLNATASSIQNPGYSVTTTNVASTDFGQTWLLGDPKNGVSPLDQSFPGAVERQPVRDAPGQLAWRRHSPRHQLHREQPQPRAPARAAVARRGAAGGAAQHVRRDRLQRRAWRPPRHEHRRELRARAVSTPAATCATRRSRRCCRAT